MSVTGFWIIGAISSAAVEQLRTSLPAHPSQLAEPEDLSWWREMDDAALTEPEARGYGRSCPTDAVSRFAEMVRAQRPDLDTDACMTALADLGDDDRFVAAIRKGDPVATLYYGLGFEAAHVLPGRFGCFLLTAAEVASAVPGLDAILAMDQQRRAQVVGRIRAWLEVSGDAGDLFDIDALIDGAPQVLLRAREQRQGALGIVQWY